MVACDIRMQILPDTLNGIMVRTVRWQKVQPDSFRKSHQSHRDDEAAMNAVIIQDHVDDFRAGIHLRQLVEQVPKEPTVFLFAFHPVNLPAAHVHGSRQIPLFVLPRGQRFFLLPLAHPIKANIGIQMNIDLVLVDRRLRAWQGREQTPQSIDTPGFYRGMPRTLHAWTRIGATRPDQSQGAAHGCHMNANTCLALHRDHQHFSGPCRPSPTVLWRLAAHHTIQKPQKVFGQFLGPVVFTPIPERSFAAFLKTLGDPVNRGVVDFQHMLDFPGAASAPKIKDYQVAYPHRSLATFLKAFAKPFLDAEGLSLENNSHGNSSLGLGALGLSRDSHFLFPLLKKTLPGRAAESRTVI